ncbi:MAG: hypothetical protein ACP5E4_02830 [Candidatus Aenigmatarchaeota archaeon]
MDIEKKILGILGKRREGVTLMELADELKIHRHTLTKYVYKLDGEGKITLRKVGVAKLCYLKEGKKA